MLAAKALFWLSAGAIVWTHVGYPVAVAALARIRPRRVQKGDVTPEVTAIVPAHNEERVIARRVENLLAQEYPHERLAIVVASDASTDRTEAIVEEIAARERRVRLLRFPRGGKLATMNRAVRATSGEIVAFSDANAVWAPDALAKLVRSFADEDVSYVCGQLRFERPDGSNREGLYWRYELWVRQSESLLGSITGGNGAIYAVRRADYVEHRFGHDLGLPDRITARGKRAVYEPEALAVEKPPAELEGEYGRKVRMFPWGWQHLFEGGMLRGVGPLYLFELVSHRVVRYATGVLHLILLGTSVALVGEGLVYELALSAQLALLALAAAGRLRLPIPGAAVAYYYVLVTWATVVSLTRYLRTGVPPVWEKAEGTR